jgi:hypothetical protein
MTIQSGRAAPGGQQDGAAGIDSQLWTCACCRGQIIGGRTPAGLCRACTALALTGPDPAAAAALATRLAALAAPTAAGRRTP